MFELALLAMTYSKILVRAYLGASGQPSLSRCHPDAPGGGISTPTVSPSNTAHKKSLRSPAPCKEDTPKQKDAERPHFVATQSIATSEGSRGCVFLGTFGVHMRYPKIDRRYTSSPILCDSVSAAKK